MVDYDEMRRRDDDIRDQHMLELAKVHSQLERKLRRKIQLIYISGFIVLLLFFLFIFFT